MSMKAQHSTSKNAGDHPSPMIGGQSLAFRTAEEATPLCGCGRHVQSGGWSLAGQSGVAFVPHFPPHSKSRRSPMPNDSRPSPAFSFSAFQRFPMSFRFLIPLILFLLCPVMAPAQDAAAPINSAPPEVIELASLFKPERLPLLPQELARIALKYLHAPAWLVTLATTAVAAITVFSIFASLFALISLVERKVLARIQNRLGPNRAGPGGILQPVADGIKMLTKEDIVPYKSEWFLHLLAPVMIVIPSILALGVLPLGREWTAVPLELGLLFFFAVGSLTELSVFMAGWASGSKFPMLGAMRAISQMVSYELPLILSVARRGHAVRHAVAARHRAGTVGLPFRLHPGMEHPHPMGPRRGHPVFHRRHRRVQPHAVRSARRRIGNRGRPHDRVFRFQIRLVLHGRVSRVVRLVRPGHHLVPRRLERAAARPGHHPVVVLVLRQAGCWLFSSSSGSAAPSRGCASTS